MPGLIRWNFPFVLLGLLLAALIYGLLGLNPYLEKKLEERLTAMNGGAVEVGQLKLRVAPLRLELKDIRFHDPVLPDQVRMSLGRVEAELDAEALLYNRFVVKSGRIEAVRLAPLLPWPGSARGLPTLLPYGDDSSLALAAAFLASESEFGEARGGEWEKVPSAQAAAALQSEMNERLSQWKAQIQQQRSEHQAERDTLQSAQQNAAHAATVLTQLAKNSSDLEVLEQRVSTESAALLSRIQSLSEILPHDLTVMRQALPFPNLEFRTLAAEIAGEQLRKEMGLVDEWVLRFLPWLESRRLALRPEFGREQGTEFVFSGRTLAPKFWVQKLTIDSQPVPDQGIGAVSGQILDFSSEIYRRPAQIQIQGEFPAAEVQGLSLRMDLDHRPEGAGDKVSLSMTRYPIRDLSIVGTPSLSFGLAQAEARLNLEVALKGEDLQVNALQSLDKLKFKMESPSPRTREVFEKALSGVSAYQLDATAQGQRGRLNWTFASGLADTLKVQLGEVLNQELSEYQLSLKQQAEEKIAAKRLELEGQMGSELEALRVAIEQEKKVIRELLAAYGERAGKPSRP